ICATPSMWIMTAPELPVRFIGRATSRAGRPLKGSLATTRWRSGAGGSGRLAEEIEAAAALRLAVVERAVGLDQQVVGGKTVIGRQRDADGQPHLDVPADHLERVGQRLEQAPGE